MKTLPYALTTSLLLVTTQAFSWGGPVMDTFGNRITTTTGDCYYYGDVGPSACDTETMSAEPVVKNIIKLDDVTFKTDSAELNSTSNATLDDAAKQLVENGDVKVIVAGHTDNTGDTLNNLSLSQDRANSVRTYLIEQGVNGDKLIARGYGDTESIASNDEASGRAMNRRVELRILK